MRENLYKLMQNETKSKILKYILHLIIFIIVFDQFISLSYFVYNYTKLYDYGSLMKRSCDSNYSEYETTRFHLSNNISKLILQNDIYSNNYLSLLLLSTIIVSLFISYTFVLLFTENITNNGITTFINSYYKGSLFDDITDIVSSLSSMKTILIFIVKSILILYLLLVIPLTLVLKTQDINISPFNDMLNNPDQKSIAFFVVHIILALSIFFIHNVFYMKISYLTNIISFVSFYVLYWYSYTIYDIYDQTIKKNNQSNANEDNDKLKEDNFNKNYTERIFDLEKNTILNFINKVFGFTFQNNTFYYMNTVTLIIMIILIAFYLFIHLFKQNGYTMGGIFDIETFDKDYIFKLIMVPMLILYIINIIVLSTKEYNTILNKYIIYKPNNLYKYFLKNINTIFNTIIENDKANVQNDSICPNYANAINLIIYSTLLGNYKGTKFVPQFHYTTNCSSGKYIDYTSIKEYNMDFYLQKKNIFYADGKCSSVNNEIIKVIMKNLLPKYESKITEEDFNRYKEIFKKKILFAIYNVKYGKTYDGARQMIKTNDFNANNKIVSIDEKLLNEFNDKYLNENNLQNIINEVTKEFDTYVRIMHKHIKTSIRSICKCNKIEDFTEKGYKVISQKIDNTIDNYNGEYSLNIKRNFIEKFKTLTISMINKINSSLSQRVQITDNNFRLTKFIIGNFNMYQEEKYNKFFKDRFDKLVANENVDINKYENIETIMETINEINDSIDKYVLESNDLYKESIKIDIFNKITQLQYQKTNFNNIMNSKTKSGNMNYITKMIFETQNEFIENVIVLLVKIKNVITKKGLSNNFNEVLNANTTKDTMNINDIAMIGSNLLTNIDTLTYEEYKNKYNILLSLLDNKIDVINNLNNDMYKKSSVSNQEVSLEVQEQYNKDITNIGYDTSSSIYILFVIYFINNLITTYIVN